MPDIITARRPDRPRVGFTAARIPEYRDRPVRFYIPADYQPKYAYPLVVMFHGDREDEDAAARLAPELSRRNYITACPRGGVPGGNDPSGRRQYSWDMGDERLQPYIADLLEHASGEFHIHESRVYLLGIGAGATVAYHLGLLLRDRIAGIVALNGSFESRRFRSAHGLRVFVGHGSSNPDVPVSQAQHAARRMIRMGAEVRFQAYPTTHRLHGDMLRDVNRWIMDRVTPDFDSIPNPAS